jgi:hypothetical protein
MENSHTQKPWGIRHQPMARTGHTLRRLAISRQNGFHVKHVTINQFHSPSASLPYQPRQSATKSVSVHQPGAADSRRNSPPLRARSHAARIAQGRHKMERRIRGKRGTGAREWGPTRSRRRGSRRRWAAGWSASPIPRPGWHPRRPPSTMIRCCRTWSPCRPHRTGTAPHPLLHSPDWLVRSVWFCWFVNAPRPGAAWGRQAPTAPDRDWGCEQTKAAPSPDPEGSSVAVREAGRGAERW